MILSFREGGQFTTFLKIDKKDWYIQEGGQGIPQKMFTLPSWICFILVLISDSGLKRQRTRFLLYICICVAIAIVIGDGLKYLLGRYRPIMLFEHNLYGLHFFSAEWALNSTPSGHTIRAFSLLTALAMLYRRFAFVFISIALLIGLSRVAVTAHYPSDVLFGAYIGILTAVWTYQYFFVKDSEFDTLTS